MTPLRGRGIVRHGLAVISPNTLTIFGEIAQPKFPPRRTSGGGLAVPRGLLFVILRDTRRGHIGPAEQVFCLGIPSLSFLLERVKVRGTRPLGSRRTRPLLGLC